MQEYTSKFENFAGEIRDNLQRRRHEKERQKKLILVRANAMEIVEESQKEIQDSAAAEVQALQNLEALRNKIDDLRKAFDEQQKQEATAFDAGVKELEQEFLAALKQDTPVETAK